MAKYHYFDEVKLDNAQKKAQERIAGLKSSIAAKNQLIKASEDKEEIKKISAAIKILEGQLNQGEEFVLEEYLKTLGRVEDEKGNKILTSHDYIIGEEKIAQREKDRKENRAGLKK